MAMHDWNHDGKKDYADNAVEMMILDDIDGDDKPSGGGSSSGIGCSGVILGIIVVAIILIIT